MDPRIAVIMPCYNDGELAHQAVHSVRETEPVEVVVVDDGSTEDATHIALERLSAEGAVVIRHGENTGVSAARMTGLEATSAGFVFPLDADDLAVPGALKAMADLLDASPDAGLCFGDYLEFGGRELLRAVPERLDAYRVAYTNEYPNSALFRRSLLDSVGGWAATPPSTEDWDLWMTLAEHGITAIHAGAGFPTYRHRIREGLTTAAYGQRGELQRLLRARHPALFEQIQSHRRRSDMSAIRKLLYPIVYGGRRRFRFEPRLKDALDRLGVWTLRR